MSIKCFKRSKEQLIGIFYSFLLEVEVTCKKWIFIVEHVLKLVVEVVLKAHVVTH